MCHKKQELEFKQTYILYTPIILSEIESKLQIKDKYSTMAELSYECLMNPKFVNSIPEERPIIKNKIENGMKMKLPNYKTAPISFKEKNTKWFIVFPIENKLLIGVLEND